MASPAPAIAVRHAVSVDRSAIADMLRAFSAYLEAIEPGESFANKADELVDLSLGPDPVCRTLIAEGGGEALGYVSFHAGVWETYKAIYVVSLFVKPEARGRGVGRLLMERVRLLGKEMGAGRIVWFVWKRNEAATAFYKSLGAKIFDGDHLMAWAVEPEPG
ncbi:MAG TPA: GNAT family N-acetyltransferase [Aestuariivirgaceae bacterium]|nr:GNAT family N-acetyltransferase [Aestuariivirgaceae bacterium]